MKKILSFIIISLNLITLSFAQYKGVSFDEERSVFNENQPLPSESSIMLRGQANSNIHIINLEILDPKGKEDRKPLYSNRWKRTRGDNTAYFLLPINYPLKGNSTYDISIQYYQPATPEELTKLHLSLKQYIYTYLEQVISIQKNSLKLQKNTKQVVADLDRIVKHKFVDYQNYMNKDFEGFSELILQKLKQVSTTNLSKGIALFQHQEKKEAKTSYRDKILAELKELIRIELDEYTNLEWFKMVDKKYIDNYYTQKIKRTIAIQGGFGGVYLGNNNANIALGAAPYIGLAFPLSNQHSRNKFLSNMAINLGVFLTDFTTNNNQIVSGPIVKRPTYIGLSYKIFSFININAGATFLENATTAGQLSGLGNKVYIRPFVGISAQVNLWADFSK